MVRAAKRRSARSRAPAARRTDGLETERFPEATFALGEPVELDALPVVGVPVAVVARGELTLHGVTRSVEIPLDARWNGDTIDVAGSLPIAFADYEIHPPNVGGFVEVDDHGTLELQLTFRRA